jgi:hypothetical protein
MPERLDKGMCIKTKRPIIPYKTHFNFAKAEVKDNCKTRKIAKDKKAVR